MALFVFSLGWFWEFLLRHRVVLRFVTNIAQSLPANYKEEIHEWLRFNRQNRILTLLLQLPFDQPPSPLSLHLICNYDQGRIPLNRICNVDETPLSWEYLIERTYDLQGAKTIWSKSTESGSEKPQCTLFLCIFADEVPWVPPILIFTVSSGTRIQQRESHPWNKRVHVEFSPTGWMNKNLLTKLILQYLVPIFGSHRALFIFNQFHAHLTFQVLQTCRESNIIPSLIQAGTTPMTQPLDIALNKPFKGLIKEFTEEIREKKEDLEDIEKWTVSQHRVVTTEAVGRAWDKWHQSDSQRKVIIQSFRSSGISLPIDGSSDSELSIKGFAPGELRVGDWAHSEAAGKSGFGTSENENTELLPSDPIAEDEACEFTLIDE